jgi:hypothetical protein
MTTALEGGEWSAARPCRTLPPGRTRYPFYRRLGGPQGRSERAEILVPTGIRSRTVQPVVSRYTDWATRPTFVYVGSIIIYVPVTEYFDCYYDLLYFCNMLQNVITLLLLGSITVTVIRVYYIHIFYRILLLLLGYGIVFLRRLSCIVCLLSFCFC